MMRDPFLIEGPAVISFSGGRTSGYMLWRILQAHGGTLPDDICVIFANTGKEMPETLDFVQECSDRWNVPITWVEYRPKIDGQKQFAIVDYYCASRLGEPYEAVINDRGMLPNQVSPFCSSELKTRTMHRLIRSWSWDEWSACVGIRADEERRLAKARGRTTMETSSESLLYPLAEAGITKYVVGTFWRSVGFDLQLPNMNGTTMHGNCDLCFKKGQRVQSLIRENPSRALWWIAQEEKFPATTHPTANRFRIDRPSYKQMYQNALTQAEIFEFEDEVLQDCACTD
jgi:hypothetical protein